MIRCLASIQKVREDIFDPNIRDSDEYLEDPDGTKEYEYDLFVQCQEEHKQKMQLCPQVRHAGGRVQGPAGSGCTESSGE